jgi:hypothetical protein
MDSRDPAGVHDDRRRSIPTRMNDARSGWACHGRSKSGEG